MVSYQDSFPDQTPKLYSISSIDTNPKYAVM